MSRRVRLQGFVLFAALVSAGALYCASPPAVAPHHLPAAIFDSDPNHIWNRTHSCLLVRHSADGTEYGADALDPLLWAQTQHLLTGDSHDRALACLDEFLRSHAERAVQDPLKRAIFQRDLWAVFDWAAAGDDLPEQRRELETRLAEAMRRVAITPKQVRALPETYAAAVASRKFATAYDPHNPEQPFLPPELFRSDGPWVCLSAYSEEPTAIVHFSGRSRFLVFMHLPDGRDATRRYVRKLRSSADPPLAGGESGTDFLNLALPQFPVGTQVALVRQAILIDDRGNLVPTALTESVQLRVYHAVTPGPRLVNYINGPSSHDQDFFEFRMSRAELFANINGGLVAFHPGEKEYATFMTHGMDDFEAPAPLDGQGVVLKRCLGCHSDAGIHSVQSRLQWMKRPVGERQLGNDESPGDAIAWETNVTIARKRRQAEFNMLQSLWLTERD
jgi:plasmid stabilization system protein ParE